MVADRIDPSAQIPEADLLEQQAPLDPQQLTNAESEPVIPETLQDAADEADRLEQRATLPDSDEDGYPHEADEAGWIG
jgi:hypothetical protein